MDSVYLKIDNCTECPFSDNVKRGILFRPLPICTKSRRPLPSHVAVMPDRFGGGVSTIAHVDGGVPNWCPLRGAPTKTTNAEEHY